ncbi:MAG: [FeFe] hydrogenase H-cluster maturation GTPase HydF [Treponemataceae bacterium]|nr:[FeFe] hydrogenase H-cluster maturation GTPase HydF [Treponemataceae bacterium]
MIERTEIAFFGMTNTGKSLLMNAITGQKASIVSEICGTTTDPVKKTMELLPLGPVTFIDTAGLDDTSVLGKERIEKTNRILDSVSLAVIVCDASKKFPSAQEEKLVEKIKEKNLPFLIVHNKSDMLDQKELNSLSLSTNEIYASALTKYNIDLVRQKIANLAQKKEEKPLVKDLVNEGDIVLLIIPLDQAAPKGRLILPQQLVIRELLDKGAIPVCCRPQEIPECLKKLSVHPALAITDSQVFKEANQILPQEIKLTSFSILMARFKGSLNQVLEGVRVLDELCDNDRILISEGCSHRRQCGDIGSQKLPAWIEKYSGKKLNFEFTSGNTFPQDLKGYKLVLHCGACMLTENEMQSRALTCKKQNVPMTNYGTCIAAINGILERSLEPFQKGI